MFSGIRIVEDGIKSQRKAFWFMTKCNWMKKKEHNV
jgi:hypothetical protein